MKKAFWQLEKLICSISKTKVLEKCILVRSVHDISTGLIKIDPSYEQKTDGEKK